MPQRIVAVFTGNRAEYGLQLPIIRAIDAHPDLSYRLLVSGAHLDDDFGKTLSEIREDGLEVTEEVKIEMSKDTLFGTAQAIGNGVIAVSEALARVKPDLFVVYADRFEGFAAIIAGTQMGIPTAHIEGGDITEGGALDDSVRHAMTKLSHLHFTTNADAAWRIRAMGEEAWRVHDVGFPMIDLIKARNFADPEEVRARYELDLERPVVVFTQHSVTTQFDQADAQIAPALRAMTRLAGEGVQVILTYPNNDAGGRRIVDALEDTARRTGMRLHRNLGRRNYHGLLNVIGRHSGGACVGNSSSGIKETPAFQCPTIDIGSRQLGRLSGENVLRVGYDEAEILAAFRRCVEDAAFLRHCREGANPYGEGNTGPRVAEVLASVALDETLIRKKMTLRQ